MHDRTNTLRCALHQTIALSVYTYTYIYRQPSWTHVYVSRDSMRFQLVYELPVNQPSSLLIRRWQWGLFCFSWCCLSPPSGAPLERVPGYQPSLFRPIH